MATGTVSELWRYPVKSMRGERLTESEVTEAGLVGDRAYALVDAETGKVCSAKHPRLWGDSSSARRATSRPRARALRPPYPSGSRTVPRPEAMTPKWTVGCLH
jgi:uncharacterized protein YcbX